MSDIGLFPRFERDLAVWVGVTLLLGGPAAWASGRALARAWQPFGRGVLYAAMLAAVADFLCYALFQTSVLPMFRIARQAASGNLIDAAVLMSGYAATAIILVAIALVGWRAARRKQMRAQYPFLDASVPTPRAPSGEMGA